MFDDKIAKVREKTNSFIDRAQRIVVFIVGLIGVAFAASVVAFFVGIACFSFLFGFIAFVISVVIGTILLLNYINKEYGSLVSREKTDQS